MHATTTHLTKSQKKQIMQLMEGRRGELNNREYLFEGDSILTYWMANYRPAKRWEPDTWDDMEDENTLDSLPWLDTDRILTALEWYHEQPIEDALKEIEIIIAEEATTI